jgi:hypothetical protein
MNQAFVQWELVLEDKKRLVLNAPFAVFFFTWTTSAGACTGASIMGI